MGDIIGGRWNRNRKGLSGQTFRVAMVSGNEMSGTVIQTNFGATQYCGVNA